MESVGGVCVGGVCEWSVRCRGGSRNLGRMWEGDVRSAEALSNIVILTHIHNEKLALIT